MAAPAPNTFTCGALILALLAVAAPGVHAQPAAEAPASPPLDRAFWINAGLGATSLGGFAANAGMSIQYGRIVVSARGTSNVEHDSDGFFGGGTNTTTSACSSAWCAGAARGTPPWPPGSPG